jgi:hypothetical protein
VSSLDEFHEDPAKWPEVLWTDGPGAVTDFIRGYFGHLGVDPDAHLLQMKISCWADYACEAFQREHKLPRCVRKAGLLLMLDATVIFTMEQLRKKKSDYEVLSMRHELLTLGIEHLLKPDNLTMLMLQHTHYHLPKTPAPKWFVTKLEGLLNNLLRRITLMMNSIVNSCIERVLSRVDTLDQKWECNLSTKSSVVMSTQSVQTAPCFVSALNPLAASWSLPPPTVHDVLPSEASTPALDAAAAFGVSEGAAPHVIHTGCSGTSPILAHRSPALPELHEVVAAPVIDAATMDVSVSPSAIHDSRFTSSRLSPGYPPPPSHAPLPSQKVQEVVAKAAAFLDTALMDQWEALDDEPFEATMTNKGTATITRRRRRAKLPSTDEEKAAPLHSGLVELMRLEKIMSRMNEDTLRRFRHLLDLAFPSDLVSVPAKAAWAVPLPDADCEQLCRDDIVEETDEGEITCIPFSVSESKAGTLRRRFILWPKWLNDLIYKKGYTPRVPLQHGSTYLDAVCDEAATVRDFKLGFFGLPIPEYARKNFRFQSANGKFYQMTRLPMGHVCAPELMQIVSSVVAGLPSHCHPEYSLTGGRIDVWIDNLRASGSHDFAQRAAKFFDSTAALVNATWKAEDSFSDVQTYTFIGVLWRHDKRTVEVSQKVLNKLPEVAPDKITLRELEALAGRLVWSAGVLRIPLARFYFLLKWMRRKLNALNRGKATEDSLVPLPDHAREELTEFLTQCRSPAHIHPVDKKDAPMTLFVDASTKGWGAVLVSHVQQVLVAGALWTKEYTHRDIAALEAQAISNAVTSFADSLAQASDIVVVVDNTSTLAGLRKGIAKAPLVNAALLPALEGIKSLGIPVSTRYIRSADNVADAKSRGEVTSYADAVYGAKRVQDQRNGVVGGGTGGVLPLEVPHSVIFAPRAVSTPPRESASA